MQTFPLSLAVAFACVGGVFGVGEMAKVATEPTDPATHREVMTDLPRHQHLRNLPNGGGCCVWASHDMMSRYHAFRPMIGVLNDKLGGATPQDVERCFKRRAPGFSNYVNVQGKDTVELMDWAMRTGRMVCVTYDYGERYKSPGNPSGNIAHMVCLLHLDPADVENPRACILDNNFPGTWEWMSRTEFLRRHQRRFPWAVAYLLPPPPPVPTIRKEA